MTDAGPFSDSAYSNLRACVGFLLGHVIEEFDEGVLDMSALVSH